MPTHTVVDMTPLIVPLLVIAIGQAFGLIGVLAGFWFQAATARRQHRWDAEARDAQREKDAIVRADNRAIDALQRKELQRESMQANHAGQIAILESNERTELAAKEAYTEANQANMKIAALQESANLATGVPSAPYVSTSHEIGERVSPPRSRKGV